MTSKSQAIKTAALDHPIESTPKPAGAKMMKAIVQTEYGSTAEEVLLFDEIARPTIGADEVLVQVRAASVDMGTWHLMTGLPKLMRIMGFGFRQPKQANPGRSLAGTVEAVGHHVTDFRPGDEVYGTCDGSFAEYVRAQVGLLALKPANLSFEQAAAVPVSGVTALQGVRDRAQVKPEEKVLIIGASGGVGTFAVQIAKSLGAEVTGRLQHGQDGPRPGPRRRSCCRLQGRRVPRQRAALRRHPRRRRQQPVIPLTSRSHPWWKARHRRRRNRRAVAGRLRPPDSGDVVVTAGEPEAGHPRCEGERIGPVGSPRLAGIGGRCAGRRPDVPR